MNGDFWHDRSADRYVDPQLGSIDARRRLERLHAEAATLRLVREHRCSRPQPRLRARLAVELRRLADRLAPEHGAEVSPLSEEPVPSVR